MARLTPGDAAPGFAAVADDGTDVTLADFAGGGLVMYFYPAAFTSGCTTEACDFRDRRETLTESGFRIIGVSPDAPEKLARFREEYELGFPLLSDPDHEIAAAYGAWGTKKNYGREYEGLIRSTIVIGPDGTVQDAWYNVRAKGHAERVTGSLTS